MIIYAGAHIPLAQSAVLDEEEVSYACKQIAEPRSLLPVKVRSTRDFATQYFPRRINPKLLRCLQRMQ